MLLPNKVLDDIRHYAPKSSARTLDQKMEIRNPRIKVAAVILMIVFAGLACLYARNSIAPVSPARLKQLQVRMTTAEVADLLGDPKQRDVLDDGIEIWRFSRMTRKSLLVEFGTNHRVTRFEIEDG